MSIILKEKSQLCPQLQLQYRDKSRHPDLQKLRRIYKLDELIDLERSCFTNIMEIQSWVHDLWEHDPMGKCSKNDVLFILSEARKGKRFNCSAYCLVTKACLQALGYTVRRTTLKSTDSPSDRSRHVVLEVYLEDLKKWFFIDPCYDIMVTKDGRPLNIAELRQSMHDGDELEVLNPTQELSCTEYLEKIGPFLNYFSTPGRVNLQGFWKHFHLNNPHLVMIPENDPAFDLMYTGTRKNFITRSLAEFYPVL